MIMNERLPELACLYRVYQPLEESLKDIAFLVRQILQSQGEKLIDAAESDEDKNHFENFVQCLHVFYTTKENILLNCFQKNMTFVNAF